jgi:GntR family transcriptional regulator/MocR family aminotransferase
MGYLVAAENVVEHLSNVRILLDRQGDHILDNAMADVINEGTIQRYLRKTLTVYEERRNVFCDLLNCKLNGVVRFSIPEGGMTVWTEFDKSINLVRLAQKAYLKGLYMSDGTAHQYTNYSTNAVRLGFASSSIDDLAKSVDILNRIVRP